MLRKARQISLERIHKAGCSMDILSNNPNDMKKGKIGIVVASRERGRRR
jgi:hypothetical protein